MKEETLRENGWHVETTKLNAYQAKKKGGKHSKFFGLFCMAYVGHIAIYFYKIQVYFILFVMA